MIYEVYVSKFYYSPKLHWQTTHMLQSFTHLWESANVQSCKSQGDTDTFLWFCLWRHVNTGRWWNIFNKLMISYLGLYLTNRWAYSLWSAMWPGPCKCYIFPWSAQLSLGALGSAFSLHFIRSSETGFSQLSVMHILISWEVPLCFRLLLLDHTPLFSKHLKAQGMGWLPVSSYFLGAPAPLEDIVWCCLLTGDSYLWLFVVYFSPFLPMWKKQECVLRQIFNSLMGGAPVLGVVPKHSLPFHCREYCVHNLFPARRLPRRGMSEAVLTVGRPHC